MDIILIIGFIAVMTFSSVHFGPQAMRALQAKASEFRKSWNTRLPWE